MSLAISLRSELLKSKRTSAVWFTVFAAAFGPFMSLLDLVFDGVQGDKSEIFNELFTTKFMMVSAVAMPLFIILICTLLPQIEYRNNTWKQVLSSPQTKANIFISKFLNTHFFILLFLLLNRSLMLVVAVIVHFREPELHLLSQPLDGKAIAMTVVNSYAVLMAMCTIQFWLGLRMKNFIAPVAIGIASWFFGTILVLQMKSAAANFFPYSFHMFVSFQDVIRGDFVIHIRSLIISAVVLIVSFLDFTRKGRNKV